MLSLGWWLKKDVTVHEVSVQWRKRLDGLLGENMHVNMAALPLALVHYYMSRVQGTGHINLQHRCPPHRD
jgi:hypothetical protein